MADSSTTAGALYSPLMGFVYVFNLIVGTGALTMPKAFASAGWLIGSLLIGILAFMSYMSTTFVVEVMAIANAKMRHKEREREAALQRFSESMNANIERTNSVGSFDENLCDDAVKRTRSLHNRLSASCEDINSSFKNDDYDRMHEGQPLLRPNRFERKYNKHSPRPSLQDDLFQISERVEMGQMADMFFNRLGRTLFYLCIAIYLYGDLAIYAAAVPKSLRDLACGNMSCASINASRPEPKDTDICWMPDITRGDAYRIFLGVFVLALGPFTFFNVQKTKYLQITTSLLRWLAFGSMIILTIINIAGGKARGHPKMVELDGVPTLFGVCVYSFMCQHSLPSLVTPIREKSYLSKLMAADYLLILLFYLLLCLTAIFCFDNDHLMDMYTLNFQDSCDVTNVTALRYFLGLFPVFTLSTNFPIIAVTLRNNLKAMLNCNRTRPYPFIVDRIFFPLLAIVPPIGVAFLTNNLTALVGYTGSYAGAGVQYVIPAFLVLLARRDVNRVLGFGASSRNTCRSPFKRRAWIIIVFAWATVCIAFVTANHVMSFHHAGSKNATDGTWLTSKWSWMDIGRYIFSHSHLE